MRNDPQKVAQYQLRIAIGNSTVDDRLQPLAILNVEGYPASAHRPEHSHPLETSSAIHTIAQTAAIIQINPWF